MTRSSEKAGGPASIGAEPIVCDVFDRAALACAVRSYSPDLLLHELTDLPTEPRVHIDVAAARTLEALDAPSGIVTVVDS